MKMNHTDNFFKDALIDSKLNQEELFDSLDGLEMNKLNLSSSLHGFCIERGELWLSDNEINKLNLIIHKHGYHFVPLLSTSSLVKSTKQNKSSLFSIKPMLLQNENNMKESSSESVFNKLTLPPNSYFSMSTQSDTLCHSADSPSCSNANSSSLLDEFSQASKSQERSRLSKIHRISQSDRTTISNNLSIPSLQLSSSQHSNALTSFDIRSSSQSNNAVNLPIRYLRRRKREVLNGSWINTCVQIMDLLEKESASRWFLIPVDPESESVPDYLEKISCPMDFQTIRQKLSHKMYTHPFRWQEDIRTVFYNAFTYHDSSHLIWNDAFILANRFEQLCKEYEGVNPYALYNDTQLNDIMESPDSFQMSSSKNRVKHKNNDKLESLSEIETASTNNFEEKDTIVLKASKLRELIQRAAQVMQENQLKDTEFSSDSQSGIISHQASFVSTNPDKNKTGSTISNKTNEHQLPPPTLPNPPPPPVITTMRPGDKVPNIIHRRLVSTQFRQLDVHLRKAALELVKDELGINPIVACCDNNFKIDLDMLPFLKQKQLLTYLRILDSFQKKRVDEGYRICLSSNITARDPQMNRKILQNTSRVSQSFSQGNSDGETQLQEDNLMSDSHNSIMDMEDNDTLNHYDGDDLEYFKNTPHMKRTFSNAFTKPCPSDVFLPSHNFFLSADSYSFSSSDSDDSNHDDHLNETIDSKNNLSSSVFSFSDTNSKSPINHSGKGKVTMAHWINSDDNLSLFQSQNEYTSHSKINTIDCDNLVNTKDNGILDLESTSHTINGSLEIDCHTRNETSILKNGNDCCQISNDIESDSSFDLNSDVSSFSSSDSLDVDFPLSNLNQYNNNNNFISNDDKYSKVPNYHNNFSNNVRSKNSKTDHISDSDSQYSTDHCSMKPIQNTHNHGVGCRTDMNILSWSTDSTSWETYKETNPNQLPIKIQNQEEKNIGISNEKYIIKVKPNTNDE